MQTFLPYADFRSSAEVLDWRRLGNQRRESMTLLNGGWKNHPVAKMWRGHEFYLCIYTMHICEEWIRRGYNDATLHKLVDMACELEDTGPPPWIGREDLHSSHRSNLLRKDPEWYSQFGWVEPSDLPYVWP